jgi:hypothetical protein
MSVRGLCMIWYFTRENAHVDLEVHRLPDGAGYTFSVIQADGSERVEKFKDATRLVTRVLTVQQRLLDDGWAPASPGGGRRVVVQQTPAGRRRYAVKARRMVVRLHQSVTRRLAAAFGL